jgi:hypothetical protein
MNQSIRTRNIASRASPHTRQQISNPPIQRQL